MSACREWCDTIKNIEWLATSIDLTAVDGTFDQHDVTGATERQVSMIGQSQAAAVAVAWIGIPRVGDLPSSHSGLACLVSRP
jgi:hypothetical protein